MKLVNTLVGIEQLSSSFTTARESCQILGQYSRGKIILKLFSTTVEVLWTDIILLSTNYTILTISSFNVKTDTAFFLFKVNIFKSIFFSSSSFSYLCN